MKKTTALTLILFSCVCIAKSQPKVETRFTLTGKIIGRMDGSIKLSYISKNGKEINDTATLINGAFAFRGEVPGPIYATLTGNTKTRSVDDPNFTELFIAPANMSVTLQEGDFKHAEISGSVMQDDMNLLNKQKRQLNKDVAVLVLEMNKLNGAESGKSPDLLKVKKDSLYKIYYQYRALEKGVDYKFISGHSASYLSPHLMEYYFGSRKLSLDSAQLFYNSFTPEVKNSVAGKNINADILARKASAPGSMAPVFIKTDIDGKSIDLASFRNKNYVLLDFWASWCVPCREEGPRLKQIYNRYHNRGLEVISISWDSKEKDWKDAIKQDSTDMYHHVPGNMFLPGDVSMRGKYSIAGIPTFILIDKEGRIAGRYRGSDDEGSMDDLEKKLAQALPATK